VVPILCPVCPWCGDTGGELNAWMGLLNDSQRFCTNDDCRVVMWDPSVSARANLLDMLELPDGGL